MAAVTGGAAPGPALTAEGDADGADGDADGAELAEPAPESQPLPWVIKDEPIDAEPTPEGGGERPA